MKFCPLRIVSTIISVKSGFCLRIDLSTWEPVRLGVGLLGILPLGSLVT